jgi:hypothetical protein
MTTTALVVLTAIVGCSAPDILGDIDGVWRGETDGAMITLAFSGEPKHITIEGDGEKVEIPVTVKSIDNENHIVSVEVNDASTGEIEVWSIRQVWNDKETAFTLTMTLHDGTADNLSFVRNR